MPEPQRWFVLGAGRVGAVLADVLRDAGALEGVWTRSRERAEALRGRWPCAVETGAPRIPAAADAVLVALPEGRIPAVTATLADALGRPERIWLHTSGAHGAELFAGLGIAGALGACHPLHSFQGDSGDREALVGGFVAIDGEGRALEAATWLAEACGAQAHRVPADARRAYHAAAVFASNGVYALLEAARQLNEAGVGGGDALQRALAALAEGSARSAGRLGVGQAATGPVVRGDWETLRAHRECIGEMAPELLPLYREMSTILLRVAEARGLRPSALQALQHTLFGE